VISIAICDDEMCIREQLKNIISVYEIEKTENIYCDVYDDGESLLQADPKYDIIFLDVYMPGLNGIETAKKLRKEDKIVEIIYLTSYSGHTKEALSVHAFEYLEKPIKKAEIYHQLDEVISRILHRRDNEGSRHVIMEFNAGKSQLRIALEDIYYFEREDRKIKVVTKKGNFTLYDTIASIETRVNSYDFILSHQSFIINISNVKDYIKDEIVMMNNDVIPLAQKRAAEFKQAMRTFLIKQVSK
jgi:DNA-binding LytR/AlgR family response regulator